MATTSIFTATRRLSAGSKAAVLPNQRWATRNQQAQTRRAHGIECAMHPNPAPNLIAVAAPLGGSHHRRRRLRVALARGLACARSSGRTGDHRRVLVLVLGS